jgi:hypothetical protein
VGRYQAIERIAQRKVTVQELASADQDTLIDDQLEKWWADLERNSIPENGTL